MYSPITIKSGSISRSGPCEASASFDAKTERPTPLPSPPCPASFPSSRVAQILQFRRQSLRSPTHLHRSRKVRHFRRVDVWQRVEDRRQNRSLPQMRAATLQHSIADEAKYKRDDRSRVSYPGPSEGQKHSLARHVNTIQSYSSEQADAFFSPKIVDKHKPASRPSRVQIPSRARRFPDHIRHESRHIRERSHRAFDKSGLAVVGADAR